MATKSTRSKAPAKTIPVPQSKVMAADQLHKLGDTKRELQRLTTELNDKIATLTGEYQSQIDTLKTEAEALLVGLHTWCEANRASLLADGSKTANLVTGEVSWRIRPPSVSVRGAEDALEQMRQNNLFRFIREKSEINKEAILNDPDAVREIKGITIVSGLEDFIATPFEVQTS